MKIDINGLCDSFKIINIDENCSPTFVEIHPTNICNLNCVYCSYKERKQDKISLGSDVLMQLCKDLINLNVKAVCFSGGGEPTLHPQLYDAMKMLYDHGAKLSLLTNGTNYESIIKVAPFCTYVLIHLSSDEEEQIEKIMGSKAKCVFENITKIKEMAPDVLLGGRIVVNQYNKNRILNTINKGMDCGLDYVQCCPALNYEGSYEYSSSTDFEELKKNEIFNNNHIMWLEKPDSSKSKWDECFCLSKKIHATVKANGDVFLCPTHFDEDESDVIGNINTTSFDKLWNGTNHQNKIKELIKKKTLTCNKCRFNSYNDILHRINKSKNNEHKYFL